jgi:hypothetical protein
MSVAFLLAGVAAGLTVILLLWLHDPMLALLCIPMAASVLTTLALTLSFPVRKGRDRLG